MSDGTVMILYRNMSFEWKGVQAFLEIHWSLLLSVTWMCLVVILKVSLASSGHVLGTKAVHGCMHVEMIGNSHEL